ncbi:unnamed protein product [Dibothriocephalus latus]|uniref:RRM domain-containing protein n=1 Tax=Dibothriocephalus latus TaxID=60516 RepID=A0A3P7LUL1_DIBLA|nr:unnamed protein product [Dibothriocephalus latus]
MKFIMLPSRSEKEVKDMMNSNRIYLKSLPQTVTEKKLFTHFSKFGAVTDVRILTHFICLGRGFVVFRDPSAVPKVMESQPHKLQRKPITVSCGEEPRPKNTGSKTHLKQKMNPNKIFLGSLPKGTNEGSLHDYFSRFGIVIGVNVSKESKPSGRGFVDFRDSYAVLKALGSQPHKLNETVITVSMAQKPEPDIPE